MIPALRVEGLVVEHPRAGWRRPGVRAVDDVSLEVAPGSVHAVVGESGSGKTSLARGLLRLVEPVAGAVTVAGADFLSPRGTDLRRLRRELQYVPQDPLDALDPRHPVGWAVGEAARIHGRADAAPAAHGVGALLSRVGLDPGIADRYPHQLSGGQRQRVCIARALATDPAVVVLDEPFAALDPPVAAQVLETIDDLRAQQATAFLLVTHDLAMVESVADAVTVLAHGRVVEQGPTATVFATPRAPETRALLAARIPADPERARAWRLDS